MTPSPERSARRSLRWDAAYCLGVGVGTALAAPILTEHFRAPPPVLRAAGLVTAAWGGVVARLAGSRDWRRATAAVASVNAVTTAGIALTALRADRPSARVARLGAAAEVAGFALHQTVILRRTAT